MDLRNFVQITLTGTHKINMHNKQPLKSTQSTTIKLGSQITAANENLLVNHFIQWVCIEYVAFYDKFYEITTYLSKLWNFNNLTDCKPKTKNDFR